jgi:CheY-like chemotaxis protein
MNKKILVIDDEELIIRSLVKLLEKYKLEVFVAKSGQDALIMSEEISFDLIISDIRMPGINGIEAVTAIFKYLEETNQEKPSVIFITGYVDKELEKEARRLNPVAYILKPFSIAALVENVQKILK